MLPRKKGKGDAEMVKKPSMKTARAVIDRVKWDSGIPTEDFTVGYLDRFIGIIERPFSSFNFSDDIARLHIQDNFAIPEHRIQYFKYRDVKIWDKADQIDYVFGSAGPRSIKVDEFIAEYDAKCPRMASVVNQPTTQAATSQSKKRHYSNAQRPNFFLCFKVSNPKAVRNVKKVQASLDAHLRGQFHNHGCDISDSFLAENSLHVTLLMLRLGSQTAIDKAVVALRNFDVGSVFPPTLEVPIHGVSHFNGRVVVATPSPDKRAAEARMRLQQLHQALRHLMRDAVGDHVLVGNYPTYTPHMTMAKLSRKHTRQVPNAEFPLAAFESFQDCSFGSTKILAVHLCPTVRPGPSDSFYETAGTSWNLESPFLSEQTTESAIRMALARHLVNPLTARDAEKLVARIAESERPREAEAIRGSDVEASTPELLNTGDERDVIDERNKDMHEHKHEVESRDETHSAEAQTHSAEAQTHSSKNQTHQHNHANDVNPLQASNNHPIAKPSELETFRPSDDLQESPETCCPADDSSDESGSTSSHADTPDTMCQTHASVEHEVVIARRESHLKLLHALECRAGKHAREHLVGDVSEMVSTVAKLVQQADKLVVIMRGLSGAGKSTVARACASSVSGATVCSADDFFRDYQVDFNPSLLPQAHAHCARAFLDAVVTHDTPLCIVDNTNIATWEFEPYVRFAGLCGYQVAVVEMVCADESQAREFNERNEHGVPRHLALRMFSNWEELDCEALGVHQLQVVSGNAQATSRNMTPLYAGYFLSEASKNMLLEYFAPSLEIVRANHVTVEFYSKTSKTSLAQVAQVHPIGQQTAFKCIGVTANEKAQVVVLEPTKQLHHIPTRQQLHVTMATSKGTPPQFSNELMRQAGVTRLDTDESSGVKSGNCWESAILAKLQAGDTPPLITGTLSVRMTNGVLVDDPAVVANCLTQAPNTSASPQVTDIHIFDFDGTLFHTPNMEDFETITGSRWNKRRDGSFVFNKASLSGELRHKGVKQGPLFARYCDLHRKLVQQRESGEEATLKLIIMTGRQEGLREQVNAILDDWGIDVETLILKPANLRNLTCNYKANQVTNLVESGHYPGLERVHFYDDLDRNCSAVSNLGPAFSHVDFLVCGPTSRWFKQPATQTAIVSQALEQAGRFPPAAGELDVVSDVERAIANSWCAAITEACPNMKPTAKQVCQPFGSSALGRRTTDIDLCLFSPEMSGDWRSPACVKLFAAYLKKYVCAENQPEPGGYDGLVQSAWTVCGEPYIASGARCPTLMLTLNHTNGQQCSVDLVFSVLHDWPNAGVKLERAKSCADRLVVAMTHNREWDEVSTQILRSLSLVSRAKQAMLLQLNADRDFVVLLEAALLMFQRYNLYSANKAHQVFRTYQIVQLITSWLESRPTMRIGPGFDDMFREFLNYLVGLSRDEWRQVAQDEHQDPGVTIVFSQFLEHAPTAMRRMRAQFVGSTGNEPFPSSHLGESVMRPPSFARELNVFISISRKTSTVDNGSDVASPDPVLRKVSRKYLEALVSTFQGLQAYPLCERDQILGFRLWSVDASLDDEAAAKLTKVFRVVVKNNDLLQLHPSWRNHYVVGVSVA